MHCKACDKALNKRSQWRVFSDYEGVLPQEEENLCADCLLSARSSFKASFYSLSSQIEDCQSYFYKSFTDVDNILIELQTDPDHASIQIEELY